MSYYLYNMRFFTLKYTFLLNVSHNINTYKWLPILTWPKSPHDAFHDEQVAIQIFPPILLVLENALKTLDNQRPLPNENYTLPQTMECPLPDQIATQYYKYHFRISLNQLPCVF
uniref:CSON000738 protein n=1 Tax=Culicoides sonorensis TaxID=179676 RepID=A0A336LQG3_CULSO